MFLGFRARFACSDYARCADVWPLTPIKVQ